MRATTGWKTRGTSNLYQRWLPRQAPTDGHAITQTQTSGYRGDKPPDKMHHPIKETIQHRSKIIKATKKLAIFWYIILSRQLYHLLWNFTLRTIRLYAIDFHQEILQHMTDKMWNIHFRPEITTSVESTTGKYKEFISLEFIPITEREGCHRIPSRPWSTNFSLQIWRQLWPLSQSLPELDSRKKNIFQQTMRNTPESLFPITTVK